MSIVTSLIEQAQAFLSHRRNRHIVLFGIAALSLLLIFHTTNPSPLSQFSPKEAVKVLPHSGYRSTKERVERSHKLVSDQPVLRYSSSLGRQYAESIQRREALIKKLGPEPKDLEREIFLQPKTSMVHSCVCLSLSWTGSQTRASNGNTVGFPVASLVMSA